MQNKASRVRFSNLKHPFRDWQPCLRWPGCSYSVFTRRRTLLASTNAPGCSPSGRAGRSISAAEAAGIQNYNKKSPANIASPFLERCNVSRTLHGSLPSSILVNVHDQHGSLSGSMPGTALLADRPIQFMLFIWPRGLCLLVSWVT